ncbi:hypothetical protein ABZ832_10500 [Streptantibioticus parmotrematis]|uniref:hypothetical protein n=1 Tax=Streptantibioticus parmotrematis TaxID=2873249 RepID=UPI0033D6099B
MTARYHLRFQIHPSADVAADAGALAKECAEAGVAEVVLLIGAEEVYTGHLAGAAEDRWFETAAVAREVLVASGIEVSLNPWVTTGHTDRGRRDDLGFAPMVSPGGEVATAQASFACPRWRSWLRGHYGRFAELGFRVLWLEDDFRFHNHLPLDWGGGFEPLMLERLAVLAGEPVTRERAVAALTAPGPPHPLRAMLQQVWRDAQLEVATMVAREVAERSAGRSRLGLMSSRLGPASVEGRDWAALFDALTSGGLPPVQRPHFAPYTDAPGRELSYSVWMLEAQRHLRPAGVDSEPEIENWPHTAWSKSDTQTWSEMVAAQLAGSDALLLNVHPTYGGRAERYPAVGAMLRRSRPALDWIARRRSAEADALGVGLPFRQDTAARIRTGGAARGNGLLVDPALGAPPADRALDELAADPQPAADFLLRYGIPVTPRPAQVQALFGAAAWAFDDEEVRRMLSGGLLLDGVAAAVLDERGFGRWTGVRVTETVAREQDAEPGPYAMERVTAQAAHAGVSEGTGLSVNLQPALARLEPLDGATVWTRVVTADGAYWGAGRCGFVNDLGGRVMVLAATRPQDLARDDDGQRLAHAMVRFLEADCPRLPLVSGGPYLIPHLTRHQDGVHRLAVANGSADPAAVRVDFPAPPDEVHATLLTPLAEPVPAGSRLDGEPPVPHRGWLVIEW